MSYNDRNRLKLGKIFRKDLFWTKLKCKNWISKIWSLWHFNKKRIETSFKLCLPGSANVLQYLWIFGIYYLACLWIFRVYDAKFFRVSWTITGECGVAVLGRGTLSRIFSLFLFIFESMFFTFYLRELNWPHRIVSGPVISVNKPLMPTIYLKKVCFE